MIATARRPAAGRGRLWARGMATRASDCGRRNFSRACRGIRRSDESKADRHAHQQRQCRRFRGHRQKRVDFGRAPSNTSGHQKWNGTADSLNASPTITISPPSINTIVRSPSWPGSNQLRQLRGHRRQMARTQHAGQQADAIEHHAGSAGAVDGVFQRRLAALAPPLEHAGQRVRRHAGHLDAQEDVSR